MAELLEDHKQTVDALNDMQDEAGGAPAAFVLHDIPADGPLSPRQVVRVPQLAPPSLPALLVNPQPHWARQLQRGPHRARQLQRSPTGRDSCSAAPTGRDSFGTAAYARRDGSVCTAAHTTTCTGPSVGDTVKATSCAEANSLAVGDHYGNGSVRVADGAKQARLNPAACGELASQASWWKPRM